MYVEGLWRYPVKSMQGEKLDEAVVTVGGFAGDRIYALLDVETGYIVSAKNPKHWADLLKMRPTIQNGLCIHLPDGSVIMERDIESELSKYLGRRVRLLSKAEGRMQYLGYWPRIEGLMGRGEYELGETMADSFYDASPIHIIIDKSLHDIVGVNRHAVKRFRPNIIIKTDGNITEADLVGHELEIGEVVLRVSRRTKRCIITTMAQPHLDEDLGILKAIYARHGGYLGVYASVLKEGRVRVGDQARII